MSTIYPSSIASLTNPTSNDRLNSPSHSQQHIDANDSIEAITSFVGTTSSTFGITYDLRSPASNGGGHIQTAAKGGTGQTSFNKGDLLVAQSPSVLAKLAVGANTQILTSDSAASSGLSWVDRVTSKVAISGSVIGLTNSTTETSILSVNVPGSVLGTNNAVRATVYVGNINVNTGDGALTIRGQYGASSVVGIVVGSILSGATASIMGTIHMDVIAANTAVSQRLILRSNLFPPVTQPASIAAFQGMQGYSAAVGTENSTGPKTIGITAQWNLAAVDNDLNTNGAIVEKII